jgi:hypothetical protein
MRLQLEPVFLNDVLRAEAAARGSAGRLQSMAAAREQDGLDEADALADAAESIGLTEDIRQAFGEALDPLLEHEIESVEVSDVHGGMPTFRRLESSVRLQLAPAALGEMIGLLVSLIAEWQRDPERNVVSLAVGLGGSGGCACGDDLPEDAPAGPLFDR